MIIHIKVWPSIVGFMKGRGLVVGGVAVEGDVWLHSPSTVF